MIPTNAALLVMVTPIWRILGLSGRLNAILDRQYETHPCAGDIALSREQVQPGRFDVRRPFEVEDVQGAESEIPVKVLSRRTSFLESRRLA